MVQACKDLEGEWKQVSPQHDLCNVFLLQIALLDSIPALWHSSRHMELSLAKKEVAYQTECPSWQMTEANTWRENKSPAITGTHGLSHKSPGRPEGRRVFRAKA
ncbi:hypothetical protein E2C01_085883 [Portunus trituberculatus]|uniref:Uncharacterized protein n=1 Tax=Portunus trituberculatus TaxID=210409 RepID=A0A5B7J7V7_PORTR|nr:hypothetical protein [Portunus trituberculatus]